MLRRKAYDALMAWKARTDHNCLLVRGQRQVGKTFIIREFGQRNYDTVLYTDLSKDEWGRSAFSGSLDVKSIVQAFETVEHVPTLKPGSTLLIFDEIQSCPRARASLKSFNEDGRFDVIASGSLLDVRMPGTDRDDHSLIPVGSEDHLRMYSLDFEEFLWTRGVSEEIIVSVKADIHAMRSIEPPICELFSQYFREFMIIGGMPVSVQRFLDTGSFREASDALGSTLQTAYDDMEKYNTGLDALKIRSCFRTIPSQLASSNKKFKYVDIEGGKPNDSARKYRNSLDWIGGAGYGNFCYALTGLSKPLLSYVNMDQFKVYLSDTGVLSHIYGPDARRAIYESDYSYNLGALTENAVAECLMKSGFERYYYRKTNGPMMMELDFVVNLDGELAIIEVKSGKTRDHPSLSKASRFFKVDRRIMLENGNISVDEDGVEHYPLFAAAFFRSMVADHEGPEF